ncbi:XRE family transcriptional regulator [Roseovarius spongiae]|uniref:XRE family transcriptional regulator n=1 Tax=Roseovarius spongiae TaxID=2320272 RepID=A0A3A8AZX8_9RHOB|nr:XRE family transcriptional regulator [Roseovarius spongiae]RKF16640.1 XRE family transcriptional regulator [Roseovarius spongiae]
MPESRFTGARIREQRLQRGIKQTDLAAAAGISPSYLNLIEHDRRRIGGKVLLRIAGALGVEPQLLSHGAEAALISGLREAAGRVKGGAVELDRLEEFAGRFPGWAEAMVGAERRSAELERNVKALSDRLAHDPRLAESIHEVLSVVTAIRSTASILVETRKLEPEWQARFHRNIDEDSRRLAEGAKALVRYLDAAPGSDADIRSPQDELDQFLTENAYHFAAIEKRGAAAIDAVLDAAEGLTLPTARHLARMHLEDYARDAARLPRATLARALADAGCDPPALASETGVDLPTLFRRLASLPEEVAGPVGLVVCDGSGALLLRKPIAGFAVSRIVAACPLWPLYRALTQPGAPLRRTLLQAWRDARPVRAFAVTEPLGPALINEPPLLRGYMLLLPADAHAGDHDTPAPVGTSCRICPRQDCVARREPTVMQDGF